MAPDVKTLVPPNTPKPLGPYSHVAKAGSMISISATAGIDAATNELVSDDAYSQSIQILDHFRVMLASAGSDLEHVLHVNVFLKDIRDFDEMNRAYAERMGNHRPARTVICVSDLPKPGARLTMDLTAVMPG